MQIKSAGNVKTKEEMAIHPADIPYPPAALWVLDEGADASARAARVASTEVVEFDKCGAEEAWGSPILVKKVNEVWQTE